MNTTGTFYHSEHCALMNQSGFLSSNGTEEPITSDGVVTVYIHAGCKLKFTIISNINISYSSINVNFSSIEIRSYNFSGHIELSGMSIINSCFIVQFYASKDRRAKHHHQITMRYYCTIKL